MFTRPIEKRSVGQQDFGSSEKLLRVLPERPAIANHAWAFELPNARPNLIGP